MEKDYRSASKKFWQTIWRLRRGRQSSTNTVYSGGGELLTSTGDIVGRWREYFEDLLNPTDTPFIEEAEAGDSEVDSFITQAEVTEVVQKLLSGKAPGLDEIRPEYLKSQTLFVYTEFTKNNVFGQLAILKLSLSCPKHSHWEWVWPKKYMLKVPLSL